MLNQTVSPGLSFANFIFTGALSALGGQFVENLRI
jgi:hypothetical protein